MNTHSLKDYVADRFSKNLESERTDCYLCGKKLIGEITPDHIIPNNIFRPEDPYQPKLIVHHRCNNSKSKDDEWFVKQVQLRSSFNPEAEHEFSKLIYKAAKERPDAYLIGRNVRNYKFAKGIFNGITWGLEFRHKGQGLQQMRISEKDYIRFQKYLETMCRGLFMRNIPLSEPSTPKLIQCQYAYLDLKNKESGFVDSIKNLLDLTKASRFGQKWGDRVLYIGSRVTETPNKGFVFVQFYSQFGVLATFE